MDVIVVLAIAAVAGGLGIAFGILVLAPRISRALDRSDEEPGGRDDRDD
jgi:hypothetical protein